MLQIPYHMMMKKKARQIESSGWLAGLLAEGDLAHSVLGSFDLV